MMSWNALASFAMPSTSNVRITTTISTDVSTTAMTGVPNRPRTPSCFATR